MVYLLLVEWEGLGFYARAQPTYAWCFTNDRTKALPYRNERSAVQRATGTRFGSGHKNRPWRLVKVDGNFELLEQPGPFRADNPFLKHKEPLDKGPEITLAQLLKGKSA